MNVSFVDFFLICIPFLLRGLHTDVERRHIGYEVTIGILAVSLLFRWFLLPETFYTALIFSGVLSLLLFLPKWVPIGGGDIKLMIAMGSVFLPKWFAVWLGFSFLAGLMFSKMDQKSGQRLSEVQIPFMPSALVAFAGVVMLEFIIL